MRSAVSSSPDPTDPPATEDRDLTARARIRDAAIACFAEAGVASTTVRAIANASGVSPALVMHHFGSKDALRVACDQHVAALVREQKSAAVASGAGMDPLAALRRYGDGPPLLRYLARTLVDGSPHVAELVDEMVADAEGYIATGVSSGLLRPTDDPRGRAVVLTLWSLGALVLHGHADRLLGADLTGDPTGATAYFLPGLEIVGQGVMTDTAYERVRDAFGEGPHGAKEG